MLVYVAIGFFTVFGWNSGQKVWDKYVEPTFFEQKIDNSTTKDE